MGQEKIISVGIVITFSSNHKYKKGFNVKEKPLKYVRNGNTTVSYFNVNLYVFSVKKWKKNRHTMETVAIKKCCVQ